MTSTFHKIKDTLTGKEETPMESHGKHTAEHKSSKDMETEPETKQQTPHTMQAVVLEGPHKISVASRPFPSFHVPGKGDLQHGVIVKVIAAGICGSDLHAYTGRAPTKSGMTMGHENVGEVVQVGSQVRRVKEGQIVVLPFNIGCGACGHCKTSAVQACECKTINPLQTGGIYGYPMSGDWAGGQAQYLLVPWADFNCFVLEPSAIKGKLASITLMSDVLPTALHAVENADVTVGKTVYIAGAGPIGLTCAHFSLLKGAACVIVGDVNEQRLKQAKEMGCFTMDCGKVSIDKLNQELSQILHGTQYVDCAIDAVGFESAQQGHGHLHESHVKADRTAAINSCIQALAPAGKLAIPGVYLPGDTQEKQQGPLLFDLPSLFMKGLTIKTGQTPCAPHLPFLYQSILFGRTDVTKFLCIRVVPLKEAPQAYKQFHAGENCKFIIDPNGLFEKYNGGSLETRTQGAPTVGGSTSHM